MNKPFIAMSVFLLSAAAAVGGTESPTVLWQGSVQSVHAGDVSGKVPLRQFAGQRNIYAVGPAADLDGEITAIAGRFYVSRIRHGELKTTDDLSALASFLVWSEVKAWRPPMPLGAAAGNQSELEAQVEALARKAGIDVSRPFPFRLEGVFDSVDYHVLAPRRERPAAGGHAEGARRISAKRVDAEVIGFFSRKHAGIFTHRGESAHLHVVGPDGHAGHVDGIRAGKAVRISFPQ